MEVCAKAKSALGIARKAGTNAARGCLHTLLEEGNPKHGGQS